MPSLASPLVLASLLEGVVAAAVAAWALRRRSDPGATAFAALLAAIALWSLGYGVALTVAAPGPRAAMEVLVWAGRVLVPVAWVAFALAYTGRGRLVTPRLVAVLSLSPLVTLALVATDPTPLVWRDYEVVVRHGAALASYEYGPWFWWQVAYAYALVAGGSALLVEPLLAEDDLYTAQGAALLGGTAVAVAANLQWLLGVGPVPEADLTPAALTVTGLLFGVALFRYRLLGSGPAVRLLGQRSTIDDLGDAVVVVDEDGRVVDCNRAATGVLGRERAAALDERLDALLAADVLGAEGAVELHTDEGRRLFEVTVRPVVEPHHGRVGRTLVFHDVTDREQRRQRLEVLTRALRHNLRNEMTVVRLYADELVARTSGEPAELADAIRTESAELVDLSEKAESLEQLLEDARGEPERLDVGELVAASVERLRREHPDAEVVTTVPETCEVVTHDVVLETVLSNALENAVEHDPAERPHVEVSVARGDDGGVAVSVADDGPGVPAAELRPLRRGTETALEHTSGFGLWLISWGAAALGGDVRFEVDDGEGTTVIVTVPDLG